MNQFTFKHNKIIDLESLVIPCDTISLVSLHACFADEIFTAFTADITTYMVPAPAKHIDETYAFINTSVNGMRHHNELVLAIIAIDGTFLGCVGFHGRGQCRTPEVGIWLKKEAHGHHYGQQAVTHLLHWAAKHIDYDYVIYPVDKSNIASRRIPASLGGVVIQETQVNTLSGGVLDVMVYKLVV